MFNNYNLSDDIINLIYQHKAAITIQDTYRNNRNLQPSINGERILIIFNNKKKKYGTIIKINNNYIKIKYLQQIIPNWKKSNILYWKCLKCNFPYYDPKPICIKLRNYKINENSRSSSISSSNSSTPSSTQSSKVKIIKVKNWKNDLNIDNKPRITQYYKQKNKIVNNVGRYMFGFNV